MANKAKVYGQSQKWTALGIVAAYLKMHPQATLKQLQKAFPSSEINNSLETVSKITKKEKNGAFDEKLSKQATDMDMFVTLKNGTRVAFSNPMWPADKFQKLVEYAKQYNIEIADFSEAEKGAGKRGSYYVEYKKCKWWLWILIAIIIIIAVVAVVLCSK